MTNRFDAMYAQTGRPSIPPEKLLRAQLIQMLYSVRSERLLLEEIDYSLLFRWFVGMNMDEAVWDVTVFTKNRDRLLDGDVAREFLCEVVSQARDKNLTSDEHFTVDGTLIEAWASLKSFQRKGERNTPPDDPGNPTIDFHGEKRSNDTHESTTDPDALLARKGSGKEAKLSYNGNLLIENRNGLIVTTELFQANRTAERDAALVMLEQVPGAHRVTVGADKAYDTKDFVAECRNLQVTPQVAQNTNRPGGSAIDERTNAARRLCDQSEKAEAHRGKLWMAQDNRSDAQGETPWNPQSRVGIHIRRGRVQLGANAKSAGQPGWDHMRPALRARRPGPVTGAVYSMDRSLFHSKSGG